MYPPDSQSRSVAVGLVIVYESYVFPLLEVRVLGMKNLIVDRRVSHFICRELINKLLGGCDCDPEVANK